MKYKLSARKSTNGKAPRKQLATRSPRQVTVLRYRGKFVGPNGRYMTCKGENIPLVLQPRSHAADQRYRFQFKDNVFTIYWFDCQRSKSYQLYAMPHSGSAMYAAENPPKHALKTFDISQTSEEENPVIMKTHRRVKGKRCIISGTDDFTIVARVAPNEHQRWTISPALKDTALPEDASEHEEDELSNDDSNSSSEDDDSNEEVWTDEDSDISESSESEQEEDAAENNNKRPLEEDDETVEENPIKRQHQDTKSESIPSPVIN
jgi:hypothetical protein